MPKLDLPQVTLLFVETRAHKITKRVIDDCMAKVNFGDVLIYTDQPELIPVEGARYIPVPDFPDKKTAGQFYYQHACAGINTDFALMLEWDAGIKDTAMWTPDFLKYDYIGAAWNVRPGDPYDVGNGGFTIMSKRLGVFLHEHPSIPVFTDWDVCRSHRRQIEPNGFKWAPRDLALKFSWELTPLPTDGVFGFHATFTWPWMLERAEVVNRARLMLETPYLLSKMHDLVKKAPWLQEDLTEEEWKVYAEYAPPSPRSLYTAQQKANMNRIITQRRLLYATQMVKGGLKA